MYYYNLLDKSFVLATSYSPANAVPSPLKDFTAVFGMRTGVPPSVSSPEQKIYQASYNNTYVRMGKQ